MKLQAELNGEKHEIRFERDGRRVIANVDGREYDLEVSEPEPNVYLLKRDGKIFQIAVAGDPLKPGVINTYSRKGDREIKLIDPKRLRGAGDADGSADGLAEIKTAMPGKVVRLLAAVGAEVAKGDGIMIVEAMKMQNELKSPKDGTVKDVRVSEGDTVAAGETLATVE
ncbi:MAG: biotin/lipoyl-containing protein [Pyrinomonadaceae bacterium]